MSTIAKNNRESLRARFSETAKSITELYREATHAYDSGFRDALLYVHHYVLLNVPGEVAANAPFRSGSQQSKAVGPSASQQSLDAGNLLRFLQNILKRQEMTSVASRAATRQRKRTVSDLERHSGASSAETEGVIFSDRSRGAPRRRICLPAHSAEENGDAVHDMLREVRISHPTESEPAVFDEDFGLELPWQFLGTKEGLIKKD